jgi:hypothetical protein
MPSPREEERAGAIDEVRESLRLKFRLAQLYEDKGPKALHYSAIHVMDHILGQADLIGYAPGVREKIISVLRQSRSSPKKRGRHQDRDRLRNQFIADAVETLRLRGFIPTRNDTSVEECGCSIVSMALAELEIQLSEKSIARIWGKSTWAKRL